MGIRYTNIIDNLPESQVNVIKKYIDEYLGEWLYSEKSAQLKKIYYEKFISDIMYNFKDKEIEEIVNIINSKKYSNKEINDMLGINDKYTIGAIAIKHERDDHTCFDTVEELDDFMNFLHEMGYTWNSDDSLLEYRKVLKKDAPGLYLPNSLGDIEISEDTPLEDYVNILRIVIRYVETKKVMFNVKNNYTIAYKDQYKEVVDKFNSL